jgi:hypothetical protein
LRKRLPGTHFVDEAIVIAYRHGWRSRVAGVSSRTSTHFNAPDRGASRNRRAGRAHNDKETRPCHGPSMNNSR